MGTLGRAAGPAHGIGGWASVAVAAAIIATELTVVSAVNPFSGIAFLWFLLLALLAHRLFVGPLTSEPVLLFGYYACAALLLYFAQRLMLPEYYGFSGGFGIGTDDSYYYSLAADRLPADFPVRLGYWRRVHQYPSLLKFAAPFSILHPLDILFLNSAGLVLLPPFTARAARLLTGDERIARLTYGLVLICPIVLMNGVVLTRDGVTAALFIASIALFLEHRFVRAGLIGLLLFYFRLASGLQLAFALGVLVLIPLGEYDNKGRRMLFLLTFAVVGVAGALAAYPFVLPWIVEWGLLSSGFFRSQIIDVFLSRTPDASILTNLGSMSPALRTPISFTYFLVAPFLGLDQLVVDGILIPRGILNTSFAVLSIVYVKYFVQGVLTVVRNGDRKVRIATVAYLLMIAIISQVSLIIRHKTMIMPLFYIVVAYGMVRGARFTRPIGNAAAVGLIGVQLLALMEW